jgi:hypothetical protein
MRIAPSLRLTEPERQQLTQWARGRRTPARRVLRATMALLATEGHDNQHLTCRPGHQSVDRGLLAASRRAPAPARPRPGCAPRRFPEPFGASSDSIGTRRSVRCCPKSNIKKLFWTRVASEHY